MVVPWLALVLQLLLAAGLILAEASGTNDTSTSTTTFTTTTTFVTSTTSLTSETSTETSTETTMMSNTSTSLTATSSSTWSVTVSTTVSSSTKTVSVTSTLSTTGTTSVTTSTRSSVTDTQTTSISMTDTRTTSLSTTTATRTNLRPVNAAEWSESLPVCDPSVLRAVKNDLFSEVLRFASIGASLDCKDVSGELFVLLALQRCPEDAVQAVVRSFSPTSPSLFAQDSKGATPLLVAADRGFAELTLTLIRNGASRSAIDSENRTLMHFAAPWPKLLVEVLRGLPPEMVAVQLRTLDAPLGDSPLHRALAAGRYDEVYEAFQLLRQRGLTSADPTLLADVVSLQNDAGEQLVHLNAKLDLLEELLAAGADAGARTAAGAAPLHTVAALPGSASAGTLPLLLQSAQVGVSATDARGRTPMHYAAASGDRTNVLWLLDQGADIRARDAAGLVPLQVGLEHGHYGLVPFFEANGGSVLFAASGFGNVSLVRQLVIDEGMSPNAEDVRTGRTPIFEAVEQGKTEVAEFLATRNVSLVHVDKAGLSVLAAAVLARQPSAVEFLVARHVPVEQRLANLSTALHLAASAGVAQTLLVLIRSGADPSAVDFKNRSALHFASTAEAVEALLQFNATMTRSTAFGLTPLHTAASEAKLAVMDALLAARHSQVDEVDFAGNAPLHFAASGGDVAAVELLLRWCAPTGQTNDAGFLPVELAKSEEIRQLLTGGDAPSRCECDCGSLELDPLVFTGSWGIGCTTNVSCRFGGLGYGSLPLRCARNASVALGGGVTGAWEPADLALGCRPVASHSASAVVPMLRLWLALAAVLATS